MSYFLHFKCLFCTAEESGSDKVSESMSVKELKDLAKKKGIDISTCLEKAEIIETLCKALHQPVPGKPVPGNETSACY